MTRSDEDLMAAHVRSDKRAFAIWAGSQAVLKSLGVWDAIAPFAEASGSSCG